jgi:hypothetical protein
MSRLLAPASEPAGVVDCASVTPLLIIGAGRAALAFVTRLPEAALRGVLGACLPARRTRIHASAHSRARRPARRHAERFSLACVRVAVASLTPPLRAAADDAAAVVDAAGGWLEAWAARMARLGASHVRAPCTGVPFPTPLALRSFAERTKRMSELATSSPRFVPIPSVALYADFCADQLPRLPAGRLRVRKATVVSLVRFCVHTCAACAS